MWRLAWMTCISNDFIFWYFFFHCQSKQVITCNLKVLFFFFQSPPSLPLPLIKSIFPSLPPHHLYTTPLIFLSKSSESIYLVESQEHRAPSFVWPSCNFSRQPSLAVENSMGSPMTKYLIILKEWKRWSSNFFLVPSHSLWTVSMTFNHIFFFFAFTDNNH